MKYIDPLLCKYKPDVIQQIFQSLFQLPKEQFRIMSYNLLPCFRGNAGYYNSFATPFANDITQRSYAGEDITYLAAVYPVIDFEFLHEYKARKLSEREILYMQRNGRTGFPAITQARYSRRFDFPEEIQLQPRSSFRGDGPEVLQSGRALYEFACGAVNTVELDKHQTSVFEGLEQNPSRQPHIMVVEPLWILAFPNESTLY